MEYPFMIHPRRLAAAAGLFALLAASRADAQSVTFSTTGTQLCFGSAGCGVNQQVLPNSDLSVRFIPVSNVTVTADPHAVVDFGQLEVSCMVCPTTSFAGFNLYLAITQSTPTSDIGLFGAGELSGSMDFRASSAAALWGAPAELMVGAVTYSLVSNPLGLLPPSINRGVTAIQGRIATTVVPEPSTSALVGTGLLMLLGARHRRRRA
jgi:hypothetical protein